MVTRLEILKQYLAEAEKNPLANRLYIEDLLVSIEYEKKQRPIKVQEGFKAA